MKNTADLYGSLFNNGLKLYRKHEKSPVRARGSTAWPSPAEVDRELQKCMREVPRSSQQCISCMALFHIWRKLGKYKLPTSVLSLPPPCPLVSFSQSSWPRLMGEKSVSKQSSPFVIFHWNPYLSSQLHFECDLKAGQFYRIESLILICRLRVSEKHHYWLFCSCVSYSLAPTCQFLFVCDSGSLSWKEVTPRTPTNMERQASWWMTMASTSRQTCNFVAKLPAAPRRVITLPVRTDVIHPIWTSA